jgi:hypothetical protein
LGLTQRVLQQAGVRDRTARMAMSRGTALSKRWRVYRTRTVRGTPNHGRHTSAGGPDGWPRRGRRGQVPDGLHQQTR